MSQENVEIVRRLYDAVARRDAETVLSIYHPRVVWDHTHQAEVAGLMGKTIYHGHEGIRQWSLDWYDVWENVEASLEELIDAGDEDVVAVLSYAGRGRASGIKIGFVRMGGVFTIREGKVIRAAWFRTREEALEAVGLSE